MMNHNNRRDNRHNPPPQLNFEQLGGSYLSAGNLREDLFDTVAKNFGSTFARRGLHQVSSSQLRKFFMDVKELQKTICKELKEKKYSKEEKDLDPYRASIKILKSKLAYTVGKGGSPNVSRSFMTAMHKCIDMINTPYDFNKGFVAFLESVLGYYYAEGGERLR